MIELIPAILATNEKEYAEKLKQIQDSPSLKDCWVQIDFMDNKFVQNQSITPEVMVKYPTSNKIEAQLMVEYPLDWLDQLIKARVARIVVPVENVSGLLQTIIQIKQVGVEVGLSLNPQTEIAKLAPFVDQIDLVLVMSVQPGYGGQRFIPETIDKVREIKKLWGVKVEVDGGIDEKNATLLIEAGADSLVVGSHLLKGDIDENIERFWEVLQ